MKGMHGITLLELLMTLAIMAIIAIVAYPSYQHFILKGRRTEAQSQLLMLQLAQEQYRLRNGLFAEEPEQLGVLDNPYYQFAVRNVAETTYTLQASAVGPQQQDTLCTTLTVDHNDVKNPPSCW